MTDSLHKAPDAPAEGVDETLKQYDPESRKREGLGRIWLIGIAGVSVVLALFHLYTAYAGPFVDIVQRSIHLYTLLGLAFVLFPFSRHAPGDRVHLVDAALALVSIAPFSRFSCSGPSNAKTALGGIGSLQLAAGNRARKTLR